MPPKVNRRLFLRSALGLLPSAALMGCATSSPRTVATPVIGVTFAPTPTNLPTATALLPTMTPAPTLIPSPSPIPTATATPAQPLHPLTILAGRQRRYPGSAITFGQALAPGANYTRSIVSYRSDGLKINGLLTVPNTPKPANGNPILVFNHGFIPPKDYRTNEKYVMTQDRLARAGFITFKSDYRGHDQSEGSPNNYGFPDYTNDVLNALASLKTLPEADPNNVVMWGHSMGGHVSLRAMVISKEIKAGVIWGGTVGSFTEIADLHFSRTPRTTLNSISPSDTRTWRDVFFEQFGKPSERPDFWDAISATSYVADLSGPLQLHHARPDTLVPTMLTEKLVERIHAVKGDVEAYYYDNDDHNLYGNFDLAMQRTLRFLKSASKL